MQSDVTLRRLEWRQLGILKKEWELVEGPRVWARLRGTAWIAGRSQVEIDGRPHGITWEGIENVRYSVRLTAPGGDAVATMAAGPRGAGTVELADGRRFAAAPQKLFGARWDLVREDGSPVATLEKTARLRHQAAITLASDAPPAAELAAALTVAWHAYLVAARATMR